MSVTKIYLGMFCYVEKSSTDENYDIQMKVLTRRGIYYIHSAIEAAYPPQACQLEPLCFDPDHGLSN